MSLKLTDAIVAMDNGLRSLDHVIASWEAKQSELHDRIVDMEMERTARQACLREMKNLQACFPGDETIKFVIPHVYD